MEDPRNLILPKKSEDKNMIKLFDVNEREDLSHCDTMLSDFSDAVFQRAFRQYFSELGIHIRDWDGIFSEMNEDNNNLAFIRTTQDGKIIGFIQFRPTKFTSWFLRRPAALYANSGLPRNFAGKTTERHSCGWQRIISWKTKFIPAS